jgi:ferritin-like metal-binding protein YciE
MPKQMSESETREQIQSRLDELHNRIQARLDELHSDFKQLETDLRVANQESSRARKDRIEGLGYGLDSGSSTYCVSALYDPGIRNRFDVDRLLD